MPRGRWRRAVHGFGVVVAAASTLVACGGRVLGGDSADGAMPSAGGRGSNAASSPEAGRGADGERSRIPVGPAPAYPCTTVRETKQVARWVECGCTVGGHFDCIGGSLGARLLLCPEGASPGDDDLCKPAPGPEVREGCLMHDPAGGTMTCGCNATRGTELLWGCAVL
jgi:hypothetical protein